jgi:hypothetical protein
MPRGVHRTPGISWHSADPTLKPWLEAEFKRRGMETMRELLDEMAAEYRERVELLKSPAGGFWFWIHKAQEIGGNAMTGTGIPAIVVSVDDLMDRGVWEQACDLLGISVWAVNEGQIDAGEHLMLTPEQARTLGLLRQPLNSDPANLEIRETP